MATLEFFFDCSSPWTYLAFSRIEALAARTKTQIEWRPILVGGVFNAVNMELYEMRANPHPVKSRYSSKDLQDWARYCGIKIGWPKVFPVQLVVGKRKAEERTVSVRRLGVASLDETIAELVSEIETRAALITDTGTAAAAE